MLDTKLPTSEIPPEMAKKCMIFAAQGLLEKWFKKKSITKTLANPEVEKMIIVAAKELTSPELQKKWLKKVRGNGKDARRVELARKCADAIAERYHSK